MPARRKIIALLIPLLGGLAWLTWATPAHAGGPTSVHLMSMKTGRVKALSVTDETFQRLERAIGDYGRDVSSRHKPASVGGDDYGHEIRLAWLLGDIEVWRLDRVHRTAHDGIWVETVVAVDEKPLWNKAGVWHRPADQKSLLAIFVATGLLPGSARPAEEPVTAGPTAAAPTLAAPRVVTAAPAHVEASPSRTTTLALMAGTGAAGLILGAAGAVAVIRSTRRRRATGNRLPGRIVLTG